MRLGDNATQHLHPFLRLPSSAYFFFFKFGRELEQIKGPSSLFRSGEGGTNQDVLTERVSGWRKKRTEVQVNVLITHGGHLNHEETRK